MVKRCAPDLEWIDTSHGPIGRRGSLTAKLSGCNPRKGGKAKEIRLGYVRNFIRDLKVDSDCARKYILALGNWSWES